MKSIALTACFALTFAMSASADITATFIEGAPKDRFVLSSDTGVCADTPIRVTVDLEGSAGRLIFDVSEAGAGVEVFQKFELAAGGELVTGASRVTDGDTSLTLELNGLPEGADVAFTIDVDDTIGAREITVTDSEIEGAVMRVTAGNRTSEARFGQTATATLALDDCTS
ncbi:MAG: aggregation factor core [Pseudomonadota bacterium]